MTEQYQPTFGSWATTKNSFGYIKRNFSLYWSKFKIFLPYIFVIIFAQMVLATVQEEPSQFIIIPLEILKFYFLACFAITWHRVIFTGSDKAANVDPFKPQKSELAFMGMTVIITIAGALLAFISAMGAQFIGVWFIAPAILLFVAFLYFSIKILFYYPSRAVGNKETIAEILALSKGYIWKSFGAFFFISLLSYLIIIFYSFIAVIATGTLASLIGSKIVTIIISYILVLFPIALIFSPIICALYINALVNYYMLATSNKNSGKSQLPQ